MIYYHSHATERSSITYEGQAPSYNYPVSITIGLKDKYWQQAFCHELGHAYIAKLKTKSIRYETALETMRTEVLAWRFAKSFCKPKYWNEKEALNCLNEYVKHFNYKIDMSKLKIIPININRWLIDELK